MPEARSWGSSQPPSSSAQGHSLSPSALGTLAGTQVWGGSMGSAGGMERNVQLRVPKVTSPFAAMAARGGGGAVAVGAGGPPVASPFALAAQARSSQPPSFGPPSSGAWGPLLASPAESEGLASLAGVPSVDAKAAGSSGGATGSASSSSAGRMLPELKAHIAAVSLPCWGAEGGSRGGAGLRGGMGACLGTGQARCRCMRLGISKGPGVPASAHPNSSPRLPADGCWDERGRRAGGPGGRRGWRAAERAVAAGARQPARGAEGGARGYQRAAAAAVAQRRPARAGHGGQVGGGAGPCPHRGPVLHCQPPGGGALPACPVLPRLPGRLSHSGPPCRTSTSPFHSVAAQLSTRCCFEGSPWRPRQARRACALHNSCCPPPLRRACQVAVHGGGACHACAGSQPRCRGSPLDGGAHHATCPPPWSSAGDGGWEGPGLPTRLLRRGGAPAPAAPRPPGAAVRRLPVGKQGAGGAGGFSQIQGGAPLLQHSCTPARPCSGAEAAALPAPAPAHPAPAPHARRALSCPQGILILEYCAGRDLQSALGVTRQSGRGRLFGWYSRGRHVALDVAKVCCCEVPRWPGRWCSFDCMGSQLAAGNGWLPGWRERACVSTQPLPVPTGPTATAHAGAQLRGSGRSWRLVVCCADRCNHGAWHMLVAEYPPPLLPLPQLHSRALVHLDIKSSNASVPGHCKGLRRRPPAGCTPHLGSSGC